MKNSNCILLGSIIWLMFSSSLSHAQEGYVLSEIEFYNAADKYDYAMSGALYSPIFNKADVNGDGWEDLIVFDRAGEIVLPFICMPDEDDNCVWRMDYKAGKQFPQIQNFMLLQDYNCDGIKDIFTSVTQGNFAVIEVYAGYYDENNRLLFESDEYALQGSSLIECNTLDMPAITDMNGDDLPDVLLFPSEGSSISYFEQVGDCGEMIFEEKAECWGDVMFTLGPEMLLNADCGAKSVGCEGASLLALEMDDDGDKDILYSNLYGNEINLLTNSGGNEALIIDQDISFLTFDLPMSFPEFPTSFHLDVNNDGLLDLLAAPLRFASYAGAGDGFVYYFENVGSNVLPDFEFQTNSFLIDEVVKAGFNSAPAIWDYNNDGLLDIVLAGNFKHPFYSYTSKLALYENTGTIDNPVFEWVSEDFANVSQYNLKKAHPAFGDVNNDGYDDLILGQENGRIALFSWDEANESFAYQTKFLEGIDVGWEAYPQLIDINEDGFTDLLVAGRNGIESTISCYLNTGATDETFFELYTDVFGGLVVEMLDGAISPFLFKEDSSNDWYLMAGSYDGNIDLFKIEGNWYDDAVLEESALADIDVGRDATLYLKDLDSDGSPEIIAGNKRGGLMIFEEYVEASDTVGTSLEEIVNNGANIEIVQSGDQLFITLNPEDLTNSVSIELFGLNGQLLKSASFTQGQAKLQFDLPRNMSEGMGIIRILSDARNYSERLVLYKVY